MTSKISRLLENFQDVQKKKCERTGDIPSWLEGTLVRNGPGMFKFGDTEQKHLFDGMSYLCRFHFEDGEMFYSARFLESEAYKANMKAQRVIRGSFGTVSFPDPCKNIFQRFFSFFSKPETSDNCGVSFCQVGDGVYAVTETPIMTRIDLDSLEVLDKVDMRKYLTLHTYTAHCNGDEEGNVFNIGSSYGKDSAYVFAKTLNPLKHSETASSHSTELTELIGTLKATDPGMPTYYHSFGMSENYFILFESPLRLSALKLGFSRAIYNSYRDCMSWNDSKGTNVLLMNRHTGKALDIKFKAPPFFTFHHANSFEKDGFVVVDYCYMRNPGTFEELELRALRRIESSFGADDNTKMYLHRMIIPLSVDETAKVGDDLLKNCSFAGTCHAYLRDESTVFLEDMRMCDFNFEFPRYNFEHFNMKEYKYVYGSDALSFNQDVTIGVVKADVTGNGNHKVWKKPKNSHMCAEPVFIPHPQLTEEDDGILLVPVMTSEDGDNPYLVVLNSKDMTEIARFVIPESRIPFGFHGIYSGPRKAEK
ncbi:unnamed protein product [Auanema sp. JU1783]|nr:unnamed protein product [Auanema sp. JU1783]